MTKMPDEITMQSAANFTEKVNLVIDMSTLTKSQWYELPKINDNKRKNGTVKKRITRITFLFFCHA